MTVHQVGEAEYRRALRAFKDRHYDVLTGEVAILLVSMVLSIVLSVIL